MEEFQSEEGKSVWKKSLERGGLSEGVKIWEEGFNWVEFWSGMGRRVGTPVWEVRLSREKFQYGEGKSVLRSASLERRGGQSGGDLVLLGGFNLDKR